MSIRKITAVYFSPTENAKKVATFLSIYMQKQLQNLQSMNGIKDNILIDHVDFTLPEHRKQVWEFASDDLVIFSLPVYAGRVPNKVLPFVQTLFKGNRTPVVAIVMYGNRSYDNALKELCMELDKNDFLTIGAAAMVSEHAFSDKLAKDRPNEADMAELRTFASGIVDKIASHVQGTKDKNVGKQIKELDICPMDRNNIYLDLDDIPGDWPLERYYTPLRTDGKPAVFLKAKPKTNEALCNHCGICANSCPMGSISQIDCTIVEGICIKCQACIKSCPEGAKYFDDEAFLSHVEMLEKNYCRMAENKLFL